MRERIKIVFIIFIRIFIIKVLDFFTAILSNSHKKKTMLCICKAAESHEEYVSYQIKPKNTADIPILEGLNKSQSFAIVLQGPICHKDNMTVNTILFYQKVYPYARIIVSTWNDEPKTELDKLAKLGAVIVTSEKPTKSGLLNVNLQMINSLAGVKKAKELGCEFAVKTRTDQRICKPYIFDAMLSSLLNFPCTTDKQNYRLATLGIWAGGMFTPFLTCDFLYLGHTQDLIKLFSAPLDQRETSEGFRDTIVSMKRRRISEEMLVPEIYILRHYCNDILMEESEVTIEYWWHVVKDYLIIYGMKDVDLMFNKYNGLQDLNYYSSSYYGDSDSPEQMYTMCFDFFNWLNLFTGNTKYNKEYESFLDKKR